MERFFGGNPAMVIVRLVILSLIVGVLLAVLGLDPRDIVNSMRRLILGIYDMGFEAVERVLRYMLLGAVVVVPIWLVARLFKLGRGVSGSIDRRAGRPEL